MAKIGWIGLGKMGAPMARNLIDAGHSLKVYNRTASKADPLVKAGAEAASSAADASAGVDVVFAILSDDTALREVLLGPDGAIAAMGKGTILVEMSTVSKGIAGELVTAAGDRGIACIHAPVSGSVAFAAAAKLTFLTSGPRAAYEAVLPLLEKMSARQFHVGEGSEARILKLALNMMVGVSAAMMGEALALGQKNGLDRATMLEVIGASAVASPVFTYKQSALETQDYTPAFEARMMGKDFDLILDAARNSAVPMPLAAQVREGWSAMIARGDGDADFFKYVELAASQAGLDTPD